MARRMVLLELARVNYLRGRDPVRSLRSGSGPMQCRFTPRLRRSLKRDRQLPRGINARTDAIRAEMESAMRVVKVRHRVRLRFQT